MEYKRAFTSIEDLVKNYSATYTEAIKQAEIAQLLGTSNSLFHDQETKAEELCKCNKTELDRQREETNIFIDEKIKTYGGFRKGIRRETSTFKTCINKHFVCLASEI